MISDWLTRSVKIISKDVSENVFEKWSLCRFFDFRIDSTELNTVELFNFRIHYHPIRHFRVLILSSIN